MPFDDELPQREPFKHWSVRRVAGTGRRERDAPMSRPAYWTDSFEPATRLLPDVHPCAGTVERVLLSVTAGIRTPLLSLMGWAPTLREGRRWSQHPERRWYWAAAVRAPQGPNCAAERGEITRCSLLLLYR